MPEPSRLVLLNQLHGVNPGIKIRFLGCVHSYDVQTATLMLRDRYPATTPDVATAAVSIDNVLEGLDHNLLQVGAWLNVMATVVQSARLEDLPAAVGDTRANRRVPNNVTCVEASMIWSAGVIKLDQYEAAVKAAQIPLAADK